MSIGGRRWSAWLVALSFVLSGIGVALAPSAHATTSTVAGGYTPVVPARILDTRTGLGAAKRPVNPNETVTLQVAGRGGVPASGVSAVVLNLTVTEVKAAGFLTAFPGGGTAPNASNLNFGPGDTKPNLVTVALSASGTASIKSSSAGTVQLVADVAGWYLGGTPTRPGTFVALPPARILDSRTGNGAALRAVGANETVTLAVAGRGGVPAAGAGAVVMNVTVTNGTAAGFVTAYPSNVTRPTSSNVNYGPSQVTANLVTVGLGPDGAVKLTNSSSGTVHLIADVAGYYRAGTGVDTGAFVAIAPQRILDTRSGNGSPYGALEARGTINLQTNGRPGIPSSHVGAVVANVTVTQPSAGGFVTVYPSSADRPVASNLNYVPGQTVPNAAVVALGSDGYLKLTATSTGTEHLILDVSGYFVDNSQVPTPLSLSLASGRLGSLYNGTATQAQVVAAVNRVLGPPVWDSGPRDSCERMIFGSGPYARWVRWTNGFTISFLAAVADNATATQYLDGWTVPDNQAQPVKLTLPAGSVWRPSFAQLEAQFGVSRTRSLGYTWLDDGNHLTFWAESETASLPNYVSDGFGVCD